MTEKLKNVFLGCKWPDFLVTTSNRPGHCMISDDAKLLLDKLNVMYTAYSPVQLSSKRLIRARARDTEHLLMTNEMLPYSMLPIKHLSPFYHPWNFILQDWMIHCEKICTFILGFSANKDTKDGLTNYCIWPIQTCFRSWCINLNMDLHNRATLCQTYWEVVAIKWRWWSIQ